MSYTLGHQTHQSTLISIEDFGEMIDSYIRDEYLKTISSIATSVVTDVRYTLDNRRDLLWAYGDDLDILVRLNYGLVEFDLTKQGRNVVKTAITYVSLIFLCKTKNETIAKLGRL